MAPRPRDEVATAAPKPGEPRSSLQQPTYDEGPQPVGWGHSLCLVSAQWNESPQAQEPVALGLSIVKPCFSMVSTKSMLAPPR